MALLVTAWSEFSPNFIEFPVLYGLMMGSWSWINASIIEVSLGHGHVYEIILEVCSSDTILHVDSTWLFLLIVKSIVHNIIHLHGCVSFYI